MEINDWFPSGEMALLRCWAPGRAWLLLGARLWVGAQLWAGTRSSSVVCSWPAAGAVAGFQRGSCCMASAGNFSCRDSFALPLGLCYVVSFALHCCGWPTVTQEPEVLQNANPRVKAACCPGVLPTWTAGSTSTSQPLLSSLRCWKRKQRREDGPCPHMPVDVSDVLTHLPIR